MKVFFNVSGRNSATELAITMDTLIKSQFSIINQIARHCVQRSSRQDAPLERKHFAWKVKIYIEHGFKSDNLLFLEELLVDMPL